MHLYLSFLGNNGSSWNVSTIAISKRREITDELVNRHGIYIIKPGTHIYMDLSLSDICIGPSINTATQEVDTN